MKFLKFKLFAFLLIAISFAACEPESDSNYCQSSIYAAASDVTGPTTTTVGTPITLNVKFTTVNGCNISERFVESTGFPKEIAVLVSYQGCNCTEQSEQLTKGYVFSSTQPGEYILKFLSGNNLYITKTITVTEE